MEAKENTNNKLPQRKSPRAQWLEYNEGTYFVTVCTNERQHSFGEIRDGRMEMTGIGLFLVNELEHISLHHSHINVLQYVVMPNHFHAIIEIVGMQRAASANVNLTIPDIAHGTDAARRADAAHKTDAARSVPTGEERLKGCKKGSVRPLLSTFIGSLKSAVTRYAHECGQKFAWQPRYHDHVIRGVEDGNNIATYIENNVANWEKDCFF